MLIEVVATYSLGDGTPDRGYVTFVPLLVRADDTPVKRIVTWSPVKAVLDAFGSIRLMLNDSWDLGWVNNNNGNPIPYKIEEHLSGGVRCYSTVIKGPLFDLADAIHPDGDGNIVIAESEVEVMSIEPAKYEIWLDTSVVMPP